MIDNDDLKGAERPQKPKGLKSLLGGLFAKKEAEDDLENEAFSGERSSYQGTGASGGKEETIWRCSAAHWPDSQWVICAIFPFYTIPLHTATSSRTFIAASLSISSRMRQARC